MIKNKIDKDINLLANTKLNENTSKDAIAYLVVENAKLIKENQQLKKQKDDVVEYIKYQLSYLDFKKEEDVKAKMLGAMILVMLEDNRMLGEIDVED